MFFRNPDNKDKYTFACTLDAKCEDKDGMRTSGQARRYQDKHDAKNHPEHKRNK